MKILVYSFAFLVATCSANCGDGYDHGIGPVVQDTNFRYGQLAPVALDKVESNNFDYSQGRSQFGGEYDDFYYVPSSFGIVPEGYNLAQDNPTFQSLEHQGDGYDKAPGYPNEFLEDRQQQPEIQPFIQPEIQPFEQPVVGYEEGCSNGHSCHSQDPSYFDTEVGLNDIPQQIPNIQGGGHDSTNSAAVYANDRVRYDQEVKPNIFHQQPIVQSVEPHIDFQDYGHAPGSLGIEGQMQSFEKHRITNNGPVRDGIKTEAVNDLHRHHGAEAGIQTFPQYVGGQVGGSNNVPAPEGFHQQPRFQDSKQQGSHRGDIYIKGHGVYGNIPAVLESQRAGSNNVPAPIGLNQQPRFQTSKQQGNLRGNIHSKGNIPIPALLESQYVGGQGGGSNNVSAPVGLHQQPRFQSSTHDYNHIKGHSVYGNIPIPAIFESEILKIVHQKQSQQHNNEQGRRYNEYVADPLDVGLEAEILNAFHQQPKAPSIEPYASGSGVGLTNGQTNGFGTNGLEAEILTVLHQQPKIKTIKVVHQQPVAVLNNNPTTEETDLQVYRVKNKVFDSKRHNVVRKVKIIHKSGVDPGKSFGQSVDSNAGVSFNDKIETFNSLKIIGAIAVDGGTPAGIKW